MKKDIRFSNCSCVVTPGSFDINNIPLECPAVWKLISSGYTAGVFQLEKQLGQDWARKVKPQNVEELAILTALLRPGCLNSGMSQEYVDVKFGKSQASYLHPLLKPILESTNACLVYQEQAIRMAVEIAGFSLEEADNLRKCVTDDTRFLSKQRGWVSLKTLVKTGYQSDDFLTMDKYGFQEWSKIKRIWKTGKKATQNIETRTGFNINITKHHQVMTDKGWKARIRLNENEDFLVCVNRTDYDGKDTIERDLAIIMSGIITEGYFNLENRATFTNHDPFMMKVFTEACQNYFGENIKIYRGIVARLRKTHVQKLKKYMKLGLSRSKCIPECMMGLSKETTRQFLSFMLAAEGGVCLNGKQFEFSSASRKIIDCIKLLLLRFGITSNILPHDCKQYGIQWRLYINDYDNQYRLLNELTILWPKSKINSLKYILRNQRKSQFTLDIFPTSVVNKILNQYPSLGNYEGGTIHNSSISRRRFKRLCVKSKDINWIKTVDGNQFYDLLAKKQKHSASIMVYDFEMENSHGPQIIANGVLIHNSIGKKDAELMAKLKDRFIDGCQSTSDVPRGVAEEIFGWIEKSQRYSFNLSHAISYAMLAYQTSWLKTHFPNEFFTSYLTYSKYKGDPKEEIYKLVQDARLFGIQIFAPDIRRRNVHFDMVDKPEKGVAFGLGHIKGVGQSAIKKIIGADEDSMGTWPKFLSSVPGLHRHVGMALIKSGACGCYGLQRLEMVRQLEVILGTSIRDENGKKKDIKGLTAKERVYFFDKLQNGDSAVDILTKMGEDPDNLPAPLKSLKKAEMLELVGTMVEGGIDTTKMKKGDLATLLEQHGYGDGVERSPCANGSRRAIMLEKTEKLEGDVLDTNLANATAEKYFLGIALSCSAADDADDGLATHTCLEIAKARNGANIVTCAVVESVRHTKTKKGRNPGSPMCILNISDSTYAIDGAPVFPDVYQALKSCCKEDLICLVYGEKRNGSLIVKDIQKLI